MLSRTILYSALRKAQGGDLLQGHPGAPQRWGYRCLPPEITEPGEPAPRSMTPLPPPLPCEIGLGVGVVRGQCPGSSQPNRIGRTHLNRAHHRAGGHRSSPRGPTEMLPIEGSGFKGEVASQSWTPKLPTLHSAVTSNGPRPSSGLYQGQRDTSHRRGAFPPGHSFLGGKRLSQNYSPGDSAAPTGQDGSHSTFKQPTNKVTRTIITADQPSPPEQGAPGSRGPSARGF